MKYQKTLESIIKNTAKELSGAAKREYIAETTIELLDKSNRKAEREFGWGRETVEKLTKEAMNIYKNGIKRLENLPK